MIQFLEKLVFYLWLLYRGLSESATAKMSEFGYRFMTISNRLKESKR
jgi:hypothetical protein